MKCRRSRVSSTSSPAPRRGRGGRVAAEEPLQGEVGQAADGDQEEGHPSLGHWSAYAPSSPGCRSASRQAASSLSAAACVRARCSASQSTTSTSRAAGFTSTARCGWSVQKPVFALPKGNKIRSVPLLAQLAAALKAHIKEFPPVAVTLPWAKPDGEPKTFRLLFVDEKSRAYNRSVFNMGARKLALAAASVILPRERGARYLQAAPEDGIHALGHASVLLDAGGHQGTLRVSGPLGPRLHAAHVHASVAVQRDPYPQGDRRRFHGNGSRGGRRRRPARSPGHISAPAETHVPSMCPGRLTAPPGTLKGRGPKTPPEHHETPGQGHTKQYG